MTLLSLLDICLNCDVTFDRKCESGQTAHQGHTTEMAHGSTFFSLGWGHLEVRLQSAFVQVRDTLLQTSLLFYFRAVGQYYSKKVQSYLAILLKEH